MHPDHDRASVSTRTGIPRRAIERVGLLLEGDAEAWRELDERYRSGLIARARHRGLTHGQAEDAAQETLLALFVSLRSGRFDGRRGPLRSWLLGIFERELRRSLGRRSRRRQVFLRPEGRSEAPPLDQVADPCSDPRLPQVDDALERGLRAVRDEVSRTSYLAFELTVRERLPVPAVALRLGMSANAVRIRKHRVLVLLRRLLRRSA